MRPQGCVTLKGRADLGRGEAANSADFPTEVIIAWHMTAGLNSPPPPIFSIICRIIDGIPVPSSGGIVPLGSMGFLLAVLSKLPELVP